MALKLGSWRLHVAGINDTRLTGLATDQRNLPTLNSQYYKKMQRRTTTNAFPYLVENDTVHTCTLHSYMRKYVRTMYSLC